MSNQKILEIYFPLVDFLGKVLGSGCEVILHDISNPVNSVVAIHGTLTGRQIGDPMTDLAFDILNKNINPDENYIVNYQGRFKGIQLISSTYYIKNDKKIIGMLCINRDLTIAKNLENSISQFLESYNFLSQVNESITENFDQPISSMMNKIISETISEIGTSPKRMMIDEKIKIVHKLNERGVLTMKGSIPEIARQLNISEPTVYRYLRRKLIK